MSFNKLFNCYLILVFLLVSACQSPARKLPIFGSRKAVNRTVNGKATTDTLYQTIPDFRLLNQDSVYLTNKTFGRKIYIADFFFTRCPTICPVMHRNMLDIYRQYQDHKELQFLSHSIDFKHDLPSVLKAYAKKLGVNDARWQFVCGSKKQIYTLAEQAYMSSAALDGNAAGGFDHSGYLVLIDKHRRIRGAYLGFDTTEVRQLKEDLNLLLAEEE